MSDHLEDVLRPLMDALNGIAVDTAPVVLPVRCGLGGAKRRCGELIGNVVTTPPGLAWLPALPLQSGPFPPGSVPMLLPLTPPQDRNWFCEILYAPCGNAHHWSLAATELKRRAREKGRAPYYIERIVPTEWGPQVNDPMFWSDDDLLVAVGTVRLQASGRWPAKGISAVDRSKAEARAVVLTELFGGAGDHMHRLPDVLERMDRLGLRSD